MSVATVPVRVGDCACPDAPHAEPAPYPGSTELISGDVVFLREKASLPLGLAVQTDMAVAIREFPPEEVSSMVTARWVVSYIRHGAVGWNLRDAKHQPVPFDPQVLIDDYALGRAVGEKADELYGDVVVRPLLPKPPAPSPDGSTERPTSAPQISTPPPRRRSSRATSAATTPSTP